MRCRLLILIATVASLTLLLTGSPGLSWQPPGKGKGGPPSPTTLGNSDRLFYYLSDGAESLPMANTGKLRRYLGEFARQQGITNGQLTREEFAQFNQYLTAKLLGKGFNGKVSSDLVAVWDQVGEWEFRKRDRNGDGVLNSDEMSGFLRNNLETWDTNNDGVISLAEYQAYYRSILEDRLARDTVRKSGSTFSIKDPPAEEEDYDKRPTVIRAGKLPADLPPWFEELDTDGDGQIGLYEWRRSGKSIAEFQLMDRNGDGLLTAEEVLFYIAQQNQIRGAESAASADGGDKSPGMPKSGKPGFDKSKWKGPKRDWKDTRGGG